MTGQQSNDDVAIVGGGFAGGAVTIACARHAPELQVRLFSREEPGQGAAYGAGSPLWLMNGPARAMSVLADDPAHLVRTLGCHSDDLIERTTFGRYVAMTIERSIARSRRIKIQRNTIVDIVRVPEGFALFDARGERFVARSVVLALGNATPADTALPPSVRRFAGYVGDPWRSRAPRNFTKDILCIGSGLTAFDQVADFVEAGFTGKAFLLGRHGFLPARENPTLRGSDPHTLGLRYESPLALLRSFRAAVSRHVANGGDWREIAESIRKPSQRIWLGWTPVQRESFIEHLASLWSVLRYRVPPTTQDAVLSLQRSDRFHPLHGRIMDGREENGEIVVSYSVDGDIREVRAARVINCTGPNPDITSIDEPLSRALLRRGLVRPDALSLGFDATPLGELIDGDSLVDERFLTLGPPLRGILYETTAVPEIAAQAHSIALRLAALQREACVA